MKLSSSYSHRWRAFYFERSNRGIPGKCVAYFPSLVSRFSLSTFTPPIPSHPHSPPLLASFLSGSLPRPFERRTNDSIHSHMILMRLWLLKTEFKLFSDKVRYIRRLFQKLIKFLLFHFPHLSASFLPLLLYPSLSLSLSLISLPSYRFFEKENFWRGFMFSRWKSEIELTIGNL